MRILIATGLYPPELGGHAKYAKEIHDELIARGYEVPVAAFSKIKKLPPLVRHAVYLWKLFVHSQGCRAILAFDTWSVGVPALVVARLRRVPLIVRVGGDFLWESYIERGGELVPLPEFYNKLRVLTVKERVIYRGTRWLTRHAAKLLFNSAWQRDLWLTAYNIPLARTAVVENEYQGFVAAEPAAGRSFVAAGRATKLKNIPMLERAVAAVKVRHPEVELDMQALPRQEHEARLHHTYAVVVPSVSDINPNMIWEGLAYGKPFICTAHTGIKDRLGEFGIFIDPTNQGALEDALEKLLDAEVYAGYVERIRGFSYTHSWKQITDEILAALPEKT